MRDYRDKSRRVTSTELTPGIGKVQDALKLPRRPGKNYLVLD